MALSDIVFGLKLDDSDFKNSVESNKKALGELDSVGFKKTQASAKQATRELAAMEKQASKSQKVLAGLGKASTGLNFAGIGLGAAGGTATVAGAAMKWFATPGKGKPPPIPGSAQAGRMAMGSKLMGLGSKLTTGSTVAAGAGALLGAAPAIAGMLGGGGNAGAGGVTAMTGALGNLSGMTLKAKTSSGILSGALRGIGGLAMGAAAGIGALGAGMAATMVSGMKMNANLEQSKAQFEIFTGSAQKADSIIAALKDRARITPFDTSSYVEGGAALMSAAEGSQTKLMDLLKTAEMLTVLNPKEGLTGAAVAMKNALSGDTTSLQDRFNIAPATIARMKATGKTGQDLIRAILSEMNITEKSVEKLGKTVTGMASTLMSFFGEMQGSLAGGLSTMLASKMEGWVTWISENSKWVTEMATGIGLYIADLAGVVSARISAWWSTGTHALETWFNFVMKLPEKLMESFNSGALVKGILAMVGAGTLIVWEGFKALGKMAFAGIVSGLPMLMGIIAKLVLDTLNSVVGPKMSKMLGLEVDSKKLAEGIAFQGTMLKEQFKGAGSTFMSNSKPIMEGAMMVGGGFLGDTLGMSAASAKALAPSEGNIFTRMGKAAQARGAASMQAQANQPREMTQAETMAQGQLNEALGYLNKIATKHGATTKIQLISQQPFHPASSY